MRRTRDRAPGPRAPAPAGKASVLHLGLSAFRRAQQELSDETDLPAPIARILREKRRRRDDGRANTEIPMRPDRGHLNARDAGVEPPQGHSDIGRLKGLAELHGVVAGVRAHPASH